MRRAISIRRTSSGSETSLSERTKSLYRSVRRKSSGNVNSLHERTKNLYLQVGLSAGEVAGVVLGECRRFFCIYGDTVNTAARMCKFSNRGTIRCTAQIGSHPSLAENRNFVCTSQGLVLIKGKGYMEVYDVVFKANVALRGVDQRATYRDQAPKMEASMRALAMTELSMRDCSAAKERAPPMSKASMKEPSMREISMQDCNTGEERADTACNPVNERANTACNTAGMTTLPRRQPPTRDCNTPKECKTRCAIHKSLWMRKLGEHLDLPQTSRANSVE